MARVVDGKVPRARRDGWYQRAQCRGALDEALTYCASCPVRAECLKAGQREPCGMWGGTSPVGRANAPSKHAA
jgi:hypothetical protein